MLYNAVNSKYGEIQLKHTSDNVILSPKKNAAEQSFMDEAYEILNTRITQPNLYLWRGNQKVQHENNTFHKDTIIVSPFDLDWGEYDSALLTYVKIQKNSHNVIFVVEIGTEIYTCSIPFGGGWNPIERVDDLANKLAHFDLSFLGSYLTKLIERVVADQRWISVRTKICTKSDYQVYRCDIHYGFTDQGRLYTSFILNKAGDVCILTPNDQGEMPPLETIPFNYKFVKGEQNLWVIEALERKD